MVFTLDGDAKIGAHGRIVLGYLICVRHFFSQIENSQKSYTSKNCFRLL